MRALRCVTCEDTHVHELTRVLLKVSYHDRPLGEKIVQGVLVIDLKIQVLHEGVFHLDHCAEHKRQLDLEHIGVLWHQVIFILEELVDEQVDFPKVSLDGLEVQDASHERIFKVGLSKIGIFMFVLFVLTVKC